MVTAKFSSPMVKVKGCSLYSFSVSISSLAPIATLPAPSAFSTSKEVRIVVSPSEAVKVSTFPFRSNNTSSNIWRLFLLAITRLTAVN